MSGEKKEKKDLPKATAAPPTPQTIAWITQGDTRTISGPKQMSELFGMVAGQWGATKVLGGGTPDAARKALTDAFPLVTVGSDVVALRQIKRVIFVGHGGPKSGGDFFAFSGAPPPNNDPHNFLMPQGNCLDSARPYATDHFFDGLAQRLVDGAQIWFVTCYVGQSLAAAAAASLKAASAPSVSVHAYNDEVGFKWEAPKKDPTTGENVPAKVLVVKETAGMKINVSPANPFWDANF